MKLFHYSKLLPERYCQININRSNQRFGYLLALLLVILFSVTSTEVSAQLCGEASTTLAKWDFNSENIECNGAEHIDPTPITNPSITPGAFYCPNSNVGCSATVLGSVGHQNTPQFQNAICLANFYNVEAILATGTGAPFNPSSTTWDPNAKVNLSVWYDFPKNTEGCLEDFMLKVMQKQFNGSQLNFETQGVGVKRNGVLIYSETQPITVANVNGQAFEFNFSGSEFCSDGSELVEFEITFGLVHRLIGPALPGTPGQTGYDDICVRGSCQPLSYGGILPATCGTTGPNDDAGVLIQNFMPGDRYDYNEGSTYTGSATFASGSTAVPADGIVPNFPNPAGNKDYSFRIFNQNCESDFTVTLEPKFCCIVPTGSMLATTPATCDGTTANNDAQIKVMGVSGGAKAGISSGGTYTGPDFSAASTLVGGEFTFTGLSNPLVAQQYIVRVYESATCYVDLQTSLFNETCIVPCTPPNGVELTSTMATCAGSTKNADAIIQVANVNGGDRVGMSPSISYSGPDYDAAATLVDGAYTFSGIPSPDGMQIYTIRVFNTSDGCYIDETVEIGDPECGSCRHPAAFVVSVGENVRELDGVDNQTTFESCVTPGTIDLELTKTVSPSAGATCIASGTSFDWLLTVENKGTMTATGVNVVDLIPAGLSTTGNNPSKGTFYGGSGWALGDLAPNESATLTITTMALLNGTYTNCAYINDVTPDNDPDSSIDNTETANEDDDSCASITVTGNNTPFIEKGFSPMLTKTNEPTRLTIKIRNNHTDPITLTSDLVDDFPSSPAQMEIASTPDLYVSAGITPGGGGITATPNGTSLTIPAGTILQPGLNQIAVDITVPTLGDYCNEIAVGELKTDIGENCLGAMACIKANPAFTMAPIVTVVTEPEVVITGEITNLVITIENPNNMPMITNQEFINEIPEGLEIAGPVTTTNGTIVVQNNDTEVVLQPGTEIPSVEICTIIIPLTTDSTGTFTSVVNMNEVVTTVGTNNNNGNEEVAENSLKVVPPCLVSLSLEELFCTENAGEYVTDYNVIVELVDNVPTSGNAHLVLNGDTLQTIDVATIMPIDTFTGIQIKSDGATNVIELHFEADPVCLNPLEFKAPVPCVPDIPTPDCAAGVGGMVFYDANFDGINDGTSEGENGVMGIKVLIYDCDNNLIDSTWTDQDGEYLFPNVGSGSGPGVTPGEDYRVEFDVPDAVSCWAEQTYAGAGSATDVQFVQSSAGTCSDFGLIDPNAYCESNPDITVACFVNGDANTSNPRDAVVSWPYDNAGTGTSGKRVLAYKDQVGGLWGMAYSKQRERLYGAAFLKRHVGLASGGLGGIYEIDPTSGTPNGTVFTTIPNTGTIDNNATRGLGAPTAPSRDAAAFGQVGRMGLGDMEISTDEQFLYVVNLNDNKIYIVEIDNPSNLSTVDIPDPGCSMGSAQPFGLKIKGEKLYVGVVCDASVSGNRSDLSASVFEMDLSSNTFNATAVLAFPLDYLRSPAWPENYYSGGNVVSGGESFPNHTNKWYPWANTYDALEFNRGDNGGRYTICHPTPMLTDIEFDNSGNMILGFSDRTAHQFFSENQLPFADGADRLITIISGGDILRATSNGSNYTIEGLSTSSADEFFGGERLPGHEELAQGGLIYLQGKSEIMTTALDPITYNTGGIIKLSLTDGQQTGQGYQIFSGAGGLALKGIGLADLEPICTELPPIEAGNLVWEDINQNGSQDACEEGIPGVTVNLYDENTNYITSTTTDSTGNYVFMDLDTNTVYYITIGTPGQWNPTDSTIVIDGTEYELAEDSLGTNPLIDSDIEVTTTGSLTNVPVITFMTGEPGVNIYDLDIGLTSCPELQAIEAQQSGAATTNICMGESLDLKLTYTASPGNIAVYRGASGLTEEQLYDFAGHAGNGIVAVYADITPDPGGTMTVQTGLVPNTASVTYYFILADGNTNISPDGCQPMQSVTVTVNPQTPTADLDDAQPHEVCSENSPYVNGDENVVDLNGYVLTGYQGGTWSTTNTTAAANLNGSVFTAVKSLENQTITFRYTVPGLMPASGGECDDRIYSIQIDVVNCYASLGNVVWEDENGNGVQDDGATGIPGVQAVIYSCPGGVKGASLDTLYTNANGNYLFTLLPAGEYCVKFDLSTSTHPSKDDLVYTEQNSTVDSGDEANDSDASSVDGCTTGYTIDAGDQELDVDAGVYIPGKLGDFVWEDLDGNAVQGPGEPGIEDVLVTLTGTTGTDETINPQTAMTDDTGMYMFGDLVPGDYTVTFSQPTGYVPTADNDPKNFGSDELDSDANPDMSLIAPQVTVGSGDTIPNIDAGFIILSKLGDVVWEDMNGNGIQDNGEPGISSVDVILTGTDGLGDAIPSETISTDANGMYMFGDLYPGDYVVTFEQPNGYEPTENEDPSSLGDDESDSDADPDNNLQSPITQIISGDTIPTIDAGFVILSKIGDLVWEDDNYNGVQNNGELGIENATVTLTGTDGFGNPIQAQTTMTDDTGMYMFGDLWPGNYTVTFSQPTDMVPTGHDDPSDNGDDDDDSDADPTDNLESPATVVESGDTIPNIDAGFVDLVKLGNLVWEDVNYNGVQDNDEPGIADVLATLTGTDGLGNTVAPQTTQTNNSGEYCFTDLYPGEYVVTFENPDGYVPTENDDPSDNGDDDDDSDGNPDNSLESPINTLTSGNDDNSVDCGFLILSKLGDLVWEDVNGNAVQNTDEPGIGNVTVTLNGVNGLGNVVPTEILETDATGMYMFSDLYPGDYVVTFEQPTDYVPTPQDDPNSNGDDASDSDADPNNNLQSATTLIESGDTISIVDAGFLVLCDLNGYIWQDYNADGIQDPIEDPFANVDLTLTGMDNMENPVDTTITCTGGGTYGFHDVWPGTYDIHVENPEDTEATNKDTDPNDTKDSDFDEDDNSVVLISCFSQDIFFHDAGFYGEDFGDTPNSFNTLDGSNGPFHVIQPGKFLGLSVDSDLEGNPQNKSGYTGNGGDDNTSSKYSKGVVATSGDEDGIAFVTPMIPNHEACVEITTTALDGSNYVTGWIDFSGNGKFETAEQLQWNTNGATTADLLVANGVTTAVYCFDVPADATFDGGETHSRFRLSCEEGVQPTGGVVGGEVEDYWTAFAKIGNLVWRDYEFEGDQDEPTYEGFNGVEVELVWAGLDGVLGNTDDKVYSTTTAEINSENGKYCFYGLTPDEYIVQIPTIPAGFEPTQADMTGAEDTDSDGLSVTFTIADDFNLVTNENGLTDDPTGDNYPDDQTDMQFDFGFIAFDYGDLPAGFNTKDADAAIGAHHSIIPGMCLGTAVDSEQDGVYQDEAGFDGNGGDDHTDSDFVEGTLTGNSDEDGVEFVTPMVPGNEACVRVWAKAPTGGAVLNAWIDFDGNGQFETNNSISFTSKNGQSLNSTDADIDASNSLQEYYLCFDVPTDATFDGGETHCRFRLSKDGGLAHTDFAVGGEVEDYWIPFAKVGNYVWYDADHDGQQDEHLGEGFNGAEITLTWAGEDNILATADDKTYVTTSAQENGIDGKYCFLGLAKAQNYSLTLSVPDGYISTKEVLTGVNDNDSNTPVVNFQMPDPINTLPVGENGSADKPGFTFNYPDNQDNLEFDFGITAFDFGDLPNDFKTDTTNIGAYHVINKGMYLGTCVDSDYNGVPSTDAGFDNIGGDDEAGSAYFEGTSSSDDEDGFTLLSPMIPGEKATVQILSTMPVGTAPVVNMWIDFNGDGDFEGDANEKVLFTFVNGAFIGSDENAVLPSGENQTSEVCFTVPADALFDGGETHIRIRMSPTENMPYNGEVIGGEVEDYYIPLAKIGSVAWLDYNDDGIQNEPSVSGYNGLEITLTTPGADQALGTADDYTYTTTTATNAIGNSGTWQFCGLPEGDYQVEIDPDGLYPAKQDVADEDKDSDALIVPFTVGHTADNFPTGENGINEDPTAGSFPDEHSQLEIDWGFLAFDFGDLGDAFKTLLPSDGARHVVKSDLFLGNCVDIESEAVIDPSGNAGEGPIAGGDNADPGLRTRGNHTSSNGDEDGIRLLTPIIPGDTACIEVLSSAPAAAFLNAFIDFAGDDDFTDDGADAVIFTKVNDQPITNTTNAPVAQGQNVTTRYCFLVPNTAKYDGGEVHLRFRLSTEGGLDFGGIAFDGEVEDYWFPLAMAGNLVWYDEDKEGDQNEQGDQGAQGFNDFEVYLCIPGDDGVFGTTDDVFFNQMTKRDNNVDGKFAFCGLIEGTYHIGYNNFPDEMIPTLPKYAPKSTNDSEGLIAEVIVGKWADNMPMAESSVGDNFGNYSNFPDNQVDFTRDFGFVYAPLVGGTMAVMGVDFAQSGCGNFNATFETCFTNDRPTDLNNLNYWFDFDESEAFGNAFVRVVGAQVATTTTATTLPDLNPNFNGRGQTNLFDGTSGLLEIGQQICYEFEIEIDPNALGAPQSFQIQGMFEGGAVNDSGVEIPDLVNGGQFKETDKTDSGRQVLTSNPGQPGDTGGVNDPTPMSDCWKENTSPACNDNIQISLGADGTATIFGDDMIEDLNFPCNNGQLPYGDYFSIQIMDAQGNVIGNTVDCSHVGMTLTTKATHVMNCNECWGTITVEDKWLPVVDCNVEMTDKFGNVIQSGTEFDITCDVDLTEIPTPTATDNCSAAPTVYLISETETGDACDVLTLIRTYEVEDASGNTGNTCSQTIRITQPTVTFPEDITWTCEQYAAYPNISAATALNALITPAFAENLDPNWDDNQDDCNARSERDTDECKANFAGTYIDCIDNSGHVPLVTQSPVHDASLIDGLEDADVLEMTGSGVPNVYGLTSDGCKFNVTHADQILAACDGVSTDVTFKIVRTWTVLNWCTGIVSTEIQVIKVTDAKAPVITLDADFETELTADQYASGDTHVGCSTSGPLGVPTIEDNCSGVDVATIRLYTPAGEGIAQYDGAGNLTGFGIPAPYLATGTHTVTYEVTDNCGNKSTLDVNIRVNDGIAPVAVCREFTQVALSGGPDGTIEVHASKFDEASYDNCSPVYFLVRKMDRSDDCSGFSESNAFTPSVHFCCENIGDTVNVILKVYDRDPGIRQSLTGLAANSNECMIRVLTEDKTRPECEAPADVWINCDEVADNLDLTDVVALAAKFGDAIATDNCGATVEESAPSVDMDLCGVGTVTRNWTATDNYGNRNVGRCQQVIMIMAQNNYAIQLPGDFEEECDDAAPAELTYVENGCDLLAINIEEQDFPASPLGECKKIIKTWRVINWCEYDGSSAPIRLERRDLNGDGTIGDGFGGSRNSITGNNLNANHEWVSNGNVMTLNGTNVTVPSTGYYEYKQHIKIFDNTAPELTYNGDVEFCGGDRDEDPCTGVVNLPIEIVELCTNVTTRWELTAFSDEFTAANFSGNGTLSGRYPLGTHTVRYFVEDECGNISQLDITFEIIDCKAPTPACFNGLSVQLMPTGMVSVWATDFNASSFDYCHPIEFTANVVTDVNRDGFISADDYLTTPPTTTEIMLDCNHVGSITNVQLWVGEVSDDDVNNWDYCVTYIEVQDNNNICQGSRASVAGDIKTEKGQSVANVDVAISGSTIGAVLTDNTGEFTFSNLTEGADYSVTPTRNDDLTNGVSTFDLIQISKHILNTEKLDSPYKMIAADANNSGNISTIDLIAIRKAILKVATEFPNNTSWRFVAKDQILDANPLGDNIIEATNFNNITGAMRADFIAVKIGDVNGDAQPENGQSVDNRTFNESLMFETEDVEFEAGEELEVVFSSEQMKSIAGYQFTMHFETKVLELLEIQESTANQTNFGQTMKANGILTASWNDKADSDKAFKLIFSAKAAGKLSELLSISSEHTVAEAYALDGELMNVGIDFGTKVVIDGFTLYQNTPNPFIGMTRIGFLLPESSEGTLRVTDVLGRPLQTIEGAYKKGYNEVELNLENVSAGMLIYQLETPTHSASLKMRLVK